MPQVGSRRCRLACRYQFAILLAVSLFHSCASDLLAQTRPIATQAEMPKISQEAVNRFRKLMIISVLEGDEDTFRQAMDWDSVIARITQGIEVRADVRENFIKGLDAGERFTSKWIRERQAAIRGGGGFTFVKLHSDKSSTQAIFRLIDQMGGANFYGMVLSATSDGGVRGVDLYDYGKSELLSQSLRRPYLVAAAATNPKLRSQMKGWEAAFVDHVDDFETMSKLVQQKRPLRAFERYRAMPIELQKQQDVLFVRLHAAVLLKQGGEEHRAALDDLMACLPNATGLHLLMMDYHAYNRRFDKALQSADQLAKELGPDAWIDSKRSDFHVELKQLKNARLLADGALAREPNLMQALFAMLGVTVEQKDFAEAVATLRKMDAIRPLPLGNLEAMPKFIELSKSREFIEWKQSRVRLKAADGSIPSSRQ